MFRERLSLTFTHFVPLSFICEHTCILYELKQGKQLFGQRHMIEHKCWVADLNYQETHHRYFLVASDFMAESKKLMLVKRTSKCSSCYLSWQPWFGVGFHQHWKYLFDSQKALVCNIDFWHIHFMFRFTFLKSFFRKNT